MLRSIAFHISLILLTFLCGLAVILVSGFDPQGRRMHQIGRFWGRALLKISGVPVSVIGIEKLDPEHPYIFAANHQSQFDIFVLLGYLPRQFSWLAKAELFSIPVLGPAMRRMGSLPIDRGNRTAAMKSLHDAAAKVRSGISIAIFPEGTRGASGRLQPFKKGGLVLAIKSGQPLVPVSISGTRFIQPRGSFRIHPGPVRVVLGTPIPTADCGPRDKEKVLRLLYTAIAANFDPDYPYGLGATSLSPTPEPESTTS